ncbi:hypothetical protein [Halosimplex halobium]|uniref:hypothetical protein n=1 Tax=Halosimplex halobium TaxID=3396618 RepID=UPI003F578510
MSKEIEAVDERVQEDSTGEDRCEADEASTELAKFPELKTEESAEDTLTEFNRSLELGLAAVFAVGLVDAVVGLGSATVFDIAVPAMIFLTAETVQLILRLAGRDTGLSDYASRIPRFVSRYTGKSVSLFVAVLASLSTDPTTASVAMIGTGTATVTFGWLGFESFVDELDAAETPSEYIGVAATDLNRAAIFFAGISLILFGFLGLYLVL